MATKSRIIAQSIPRADSAGRQARRGGKELRAIYSRKKYGKRTIGGGKLLLANPNGKEKIMNECCICEGNADYITIEGGWYVCRSCIDEGKTDGLGEE